MQAIHFGVVRKSKSESLFDFIINTNQLMCNSGGGSTPTIDELKSKMGILTKAFETAFKISWPLKYRKKASSPWTNNDLSNIRKLTKEVLNICYRHTYWQPYNNCLGKYKSGTKTARKWSAVDYWQNIENINKFGRLCKILANKHKSPSFYKNSEGSWTESSGETQGLLVQTHFQASEEDRELKFCLEGM